MKEEIRDFVVQLQSFGVRYKGEILGRMGGAGPSEGITLFILTEGEEIPVNIPFYSHYVSSSPYEMVKDGEAFNILKDGKDTGLMAKVRGEPIYYSFKTKDGIPLWKIGLLHGKDCLGTTLFQSCLYYRKSDGCKFCGIGTSLKNKKTVHFKEPEDIYYLCEVASKTDNVKHITITTGTQKDRRKEVLSLALAGGFAKKAGLNVHIQFSPIDDVGIFEEIKEKGVDTIGIHIESLDQEVLKRISPWKAEIGLRNFIKNWEKGVEVFGWGQVSSFVIMGFGENMKKTLEGIRMLSSIGVFPFILPFRPIPGTPLYGKLNPPPPELMKGIYEKTAERISSFNLNPKKFKAGCVRCSACSSMGWFT